MAVTPSLSFCSSTLITFIIWSVPAWTYLIQTADSSNSYTYECNEIYFGSFSQLNESDIDNRMENYKCQYKRFTVNLFSSITYTKFNIYILEKVWLNHDQNTLHNSTETDSGWILDHQRFTTTVCMRDLKMTLEIYDIRIDHQRAFLFYSLNLSATSWLVGVQSTHQSESSLQINLSPVYKSI